MNETNIMVSVELLDNRRIKLIETFKAPLNTVFEIWTHPNVTKFLQLNTQTIQSINTQSLESKIADTDLNSYDEISTSSIISKRLKLYSHFIEYDGLTEATITLDFKLKGLASRYITETTDKAVVLIEKINDCILKIKT
ncbi:hypothetical protein [Marinicella sp. W31]|uniref:hypothetical protein n=1 Tax=Marinicella sp. W31 TaxID=3023713 RepID=UPI0037569819